MNEISEERGCPKPKIKKMKENRKYAILHYQNAYITDICSSYMEAKKILNTSINGDPSGRIIPYTKRLCWKLLRNDLELDGETGWSITVLLFGFIKYRITHKTLFKKLAFFLSKNIK